MATASSRVQEVFQCLHLAANENSNCFWVTAPLANCIEVRVAGEDGGREGLAAIDVGTWSSDILLVKLRGIERRPRCSIVANRRCQIPQDVDRWEIVWQLAYLEACNEPPLDTGSRAQTILRVKNHRLAILTMRLVEALQTIEVFGAACSQSACRTASRRNAVGDETSSTTRTKITKSIWIKDVPGNLVWQPRLCNAVRPRCVTAATTATTTATTI